MRPRIAEAPLFEIALMKLTDSLSAMFTRLRVELRHGITALIEFSEQQAEISSSVK